MKQEFNQLSNKTAPKTDLAEGAKPITEEQTCWKTNLFLQSEAQRVKERSQIFHKRTSFEEGLINDHINEMLKAVISTGLKVIPIKLPRDDKAYSQSCQNKQIDAINSNHYLTQQQKWEVHQAIFASQQNFSILMRLSSVFVQNKDQLLYLLCKILQFSTVDLHVREKFDSKKQTLLELMDKNKTKLMDKIMNQEIIKAANPLFFSNVNEIPLMRIIETWFYHVLCTKQGLYGDDLKFDIEVQETYFEQENYFQM